MKAITYDVLLTGMTFLLCHLDNLEFQEAVKAWQLNPNNK